MLDFEIHDVSDFTNSFREVNYGVTNSCDISRHLKINPFSTGNTRGRYRVYETASTPGFGSC